ncbi:MAG: hypothetical protein PHQ59_05085 [Candidatus Daviesbacteria bacterium]|nr:hypothetical protein [Candidatus Daviesbacteria bacterium]
MSVSLPEAPASVTVRIITEKGFHLLFTLRDFSGEKLMRKFEAFEKAALLKGWNPEGKEIGVSNTKKVTADSNATCEACGAPAKRRTGYRKNGTKWEGVFCSTGDDSHKMWLS